MSVHTDNHFGCHNNNNNNNNPSRAIAEDPFRTETAVSWPPAVATVSGEEDGLRRMLVALQEFSQLTAFVLGDTGR